jgi:excisionase family DNA binding protein
MFLIAASIMTMAVRQHLSIHEYDRLLAIAMYGGRPLASVNDVLAPIVKSMGTDQIIYIGDDSQAVTTSVAAEYLGVSRQYCVRILERGDNPCHYVGAHRRTCLKDVLSYLNHRTIERKAAVDSMTRE